MLSEFVLKARQWLYQNEVERRFAADLFNAPLPQQWLVDTPYGGQIFYAPEPADALCRALGIELVSPRPAVRKCIEPNTMTWLSQQKRKGLNAGPLHGRMNYGHPDSFDTFKEWFKYEPSAAAAYELLKLAYQLGRKDDTTTMIAQWAQDNPKEWLSPDKLAQDIKEENICLFGRLANKPYLMQWFMNEQPELKDQVTEKNHWKNLQKFLFQVYTNYAIPYWPATVHHAFQDDMDPLEHRMQKQDITSVNIALIAFCHSPAAQAHFVCSLKGHKIPPLKDGTFLDANVAQMHAQLQANIGVQYVPHVPERPFDKTIVDQLMLGIHLGLENEAFYHHALGILEPAKYQKQEPVFSDVDSTLFQA